VLEWKGEFGAEFVGPKLLLMNLEEGEKTREGLEPGGAEGGLEGEPFMLE